MLNYYYSSIPMLSRLFNLVPRPKYRGWINMELIFFLIPILIRMLFRPSSRAPVACSIGLFSLPKVEKITA